MKDSAASEGVLPERVFLPSASAHFYAQQDEFHDTEYVRVSVDEAAVRRAAEKIFRIVKDKFDYKGTVQDCENTTASLAEIITTELRGKQ